MVLEADFFLRASARVHQGYDLREVDKDSQVMRERFLYP